MLNIINTQYYQCIYPYSLEISRNAIHKRTLTSLDLYGDIKLLFNKRYSVVIVYITVVCNKNTDYGVPLSLIFTGLNEASSSSGNKCSSAASPTLHQQLPLLRNNTPTERERKYYDKHISNNTSNMSSHKVFYFTLSAFNR